MESAEGNLQLKELMRVVVPPFLLHLSPVGRGGTELRASNDYGGVEVQA
jgi:hypothetical protein